MDYPTMQTCLQTLLSRRTIYQFKSTPVAQTILEQALEAATWAPNHGLTEPWHFYVIGRQTQQQLARLYARLRADKRADPGTEAWQEHFDRARERFEAFPRVVFVGQIKTDSPTQQQEDAAAVACAIHNLQLALWSKGVGCQWSTGPLIRAQETRQLLQVPDTVELVAVLYIGWPACVPKSKRTPWQEKTSFLP